MGLLYDSLPEYLAITKDRQQYVTMSDIEVKDCRKTPTVACPIKRTAKRKQSAVPCAVALLLDEVEAQQNQCHRVLVPWNGAYSYYIGARKWIYSGKDGITVAVNCKDGEKTSTFSMGVLSFGVIDIPPGCSAHTDDWVLPASFHSEYQFQPDPINFNFTLMSFSPPPTGTSVPNPPHSERKSEVDNLTTIKSEKSRPPTRGYASTIFEGTR